MILAVSILITASVLALVLFVREKDLPQAPPASPVEHLESRKAVIYDNLRDLNFEYRLGKLSDSDYGKSKLTLQNELAGVLAEIDTVAHGLSAARATVRAQAVAQKAAETVKGLKCPHCGAVFEKSMKFCGECGKTMEGQA
ncbi:MAG: hypothetical protein HY858_06705 [Candidatus Solibacter usitatus]|nr:hypothetical protein [Candidatus Solibacter usitatus]